MAKSASRKDFINEMLRLFGSSLVNIRTDDIEVKELSSEQKEFLKVYKLWLKEFNAFVMLQKQNPNNMENNLKLMQLSQQASDWKNYLEDYIGLPEDHIFFLTEQDATKDNILSLLGTKLKRKASQEDTVIIFYAGHGAVETDPSNPDGDGFEKYLLPFDADLNDLFASSISMDEVRKIFNRISAERLIFIADTCYSGASGGRTLVTSKTRANLSDKFYERISKGKGRVIISSCSANEISKEDDKLQHGIFSYHMLEGLKGNADQDGDGIITVSELFSYISRTVPEASGQDQHPIKKGETEGELIIGRIK